MSGLLSWLSGGASEPAPAPAPVAPPGRVLRRVVNDCRSLARDHATQLFALQNEADALRVDCVVSGPEDTPYEGGPRAGAETLVVDGSRRRAYLVDGSKRRATRVDRSRATRVDRSRATRVGCSRARADDDPAAAFPRRPSRGGGAAKPSSQASSTSR